MAAGARNESLRRKSEPLITRFDGWGKSSLTSVLPQALNDKCYLIKVKVVSVCCSAVCGQSDCVIIHDDGQPQVWVRTQEPVVSQLSEPKQNRI